MKAIIDFETTGFSSSKDSIIEMSSVKFNEETFEITDKYDKIVLPEHGYTRWYNDGKLTKEFVRANGIPLKEAMEKFHKWTGGQTVIDFHAYNVPFDKKFFDKAFAKYPGEYMTTWTCILKLARKHLYLLESHKLEAVCKHYEINTGESHRGLDDCISALEVLKRIKKGE